MPAKSKKKTTNTSVYKVPSATISGRFILIWLIFSLAFGCFGVVGFLVWREYSRSEAENLTIPARRQKPSTQHFNNDYWGFKFYYPGSWSRVTGDAKDSEFYFSSEPIAFLSELSSTEGIMAVKAYNNYQLLSHKDWFAEAERLFMPGKVLQRQETSFFQYPAVRYQLTAYKPEIFLQHYDMLSLIKSDQTLIQIMLITPSIEVQQRLAPEFSEILDSFTFYPGFGEGR